MKIQRVYYGASAGQYDKMHVNRKDEHSFALCALLGFLDYLEVQTILDIGSGTGRAIHYIQKNRPDIQIIGIRPVVELRQIGYSSGISKTVLVDGDATDLDFKDDSFDLVREFGVLHHIRYPEKAVAEMLRVAKKAIFISDSNNFGQGSFLVRITKHIINAFGLWNMCNWIKTYGKGYTISKGDGLVYSYSVFNNYRQIRTKCPSVHILNTRGGSIPI